MNKTAARACFIVVTAIVGQALAEPASVDCAPAKLVRMVTSLVPVNEKPDFRHKPKITYRLGNGRTRLEEEPDPAQGVHLLFITDTPMVWTIDLASKSGTAAARYQMCLQ